MSKFNPTELPLYTEVELVAIKGSKVFKKIMPYGDALGIKKKKGFFYYYYQVGYSQFN